jgi:hypothetical protein
MNLLVKEKTKGFMTNELFEKNDYEDWLKWMDHEEQQNLM